MPILTPEERFGQRVADRYRLQEVLSTGGMGVLFRALDETTGERVVVKMLKPVYALEPDRVARFVRETRIAAELRHANIVAVLEVWTDETEVPFLVMELLEGRSLAQELDARGVLSFDEALSIALPIIDALAAAHAVGVIHRDIKPSNIFLSRDPSGRVVPKLLDFGIAKCEQDDFVTQTGLVLGTPGYMAPEQALLGECSAATDVWGVGAVLYHCFTGHPPHASESTAELLRKLVREPVPALGGAGVGAGLSKPARATIDRALMRDPHRRYASMRAFGDALVAATRECHDSTRADRPLEITQAELVTELAALAPPAPPRYRQHLLLLGGVLLCTLLLAWTIEPPSAGRNEPTGRSEQAGPPRQLAPLAPPTQPAAAEAPPLFADGQGQSHAQPPISNPPGSAARPAGRPAANLAANQPRRSARRTSHRSTAAPAHTLAGPAIDPKASPRAIAEPEATTGLPVATEW